VILIDITFPTMPKTAMTIQAYFVAMVYTRRRARISWPTAGAAPAAVVSKIPLVADRTYSNAVIGAGDYNNEDANYDHVQIVLNRNCDYF
jgi:hypothetical protein